MSTTYKVAVIVGSLRKESFNRKMANALIGIAPEGLKLEIVEIGGLSFYNQDFDENPPADWVAFREKIAATDAVLFVTPEYNRSVPGVLKNAIDIGSRPYGGAVLSGMPAAVMSVSPGAMGGFGANHHLRQSLTFLDMPTMGQPEAYISAAHSVFAPDGSIAKPETQDFLLKFLQRFEGWIGSHKK